jgi:MFS family permease
MHPIRDPNFRALLVTRTIGSLTQGFFSVPLMWWVMEETGSGAHVASIGLVSAVAALIASPIGGVWADRMSKKTLIFATSLLLIPAILAVAILIYADLMQVAWVYPFVVVLTLIGSVRMPALTALTPLILPKERYQEGNAAMGLSLQLGGLASFALAGTATATLQVHGAFGVAAVLMGASACAILFVREPVESFRDRPQTNVASPPRNTLGEIWEAVLIIVRNPILLWSMLVVLLINLILTPLVPIMAPFAKQELRLGPAEFGYLSSSILLGGVLGLAAMNFVRVRRRLPVLVFGTLGIAVGIGGLAFVSHLVPALALLALGGLMASIMNVQLQAISQENIPREAMARTLGIGTAIGAATAPIGYAAAVGLLAVLPLRPILAGMGALLVPASLAWLQPSIRRALRTEAEQSISEPTLAPRDARVS